MPGLTGYPHKGPSAPGDKPLLQLVIPFFFRHSIDFERRYGLAAFGRKAKLALALPLLRRSTAIVGGVGTDRRIEVETANTCIALSNSAKLGDK